MKLLLILLVGALLAGTLSAQEGRERKLLETEKHIVTVAKKEDSVVFRMEAIADFTKDRDSSKPLGAGWDFAGVRVDINNNNLIDEKVDVAFGTAQKTRSFCAQYLISENTSTGCGVLRSMGTVQVDFTSTDLQATPHPVFIFQIPVAELTSGGGKIGLTFKFSDASIGQFYFPKRRRPNTFDETIQLDLSEL